MNDKIGYGRELDGGLITLDNSEVSVFVVPTNEEIMIIKDTYELVK